jgi:hypothetical protein
VIDEVDAQVITKIVFEMIPELFRRYRIAVKEDNDQETSKLVSSADIGTASRRQ